jgi:hypothetical protein
LSVTVCKVRRLRSTAAGESTVQRQKVDTWAAEEASMLVAEDANDKERRPRKERKIATSPYRRDDNLARCIRLMVARRHPLTNLASNGRQMEECTGHGAG